MAVPSNRTQPRSVRARAGDRAQLRVVEPGGSRPSVPPRVSKAEVTDTAGNYSFERVYGAWFHDVTRWIRAFGAPTSELEDLAQEIFLVVRRRLPEFKEGNLAGWLYRITQYTVRDHRRRSWFKHLFLRRQIDFDEIPQTKDEPARAYERKEDQRILNQLLLRMSEKRRTTFVLFEVEGYSGEEIAQIQDIPLSTVWTRLYHARKDFLRLVAELSAREEREQC
jgi:RNA polymerase sigma-70 factor (ECF subfamily)